MNTIKQEPWEAGFDLQDYQWNTSSSISQSPYFNPEILSTQIKVEAEDEIISHSSSGPPPSVIKEPKKRGRPKKVKDESGISEADGKPEKQEKKLKQETITDHLAVTKKRKDRFNGTPEEEVLQKLLPDHLAPNLDILIIGINPGLFAAYVGHHYAGPGNHFWRCMFLSGLISEPMSAYDDYKLLNFGIGFTNICARTTRGSADLKKQEIRDGAEILKKKLTMYTPKIAVFNGKGIFEVFSGNKNFNIGKQPDKVEGTDTVLFVMPSSSARCAQLPRAADKVPYYLALKKLRDYIKGDLPSVDESELVFPALETKSKSEVKNEVSDEDEDSRLSVGDFSTKDLTVEQIQNQAEYLDALIASAEGTDILMGSRGSNNMLNRGDNHVDTETSGSGDEVSQLFISRTHHLKSRNGSQITRVSQSPSCGGPSVPRLDIKQETLYEASEYESLAVNGPAAQKVSLDDDLDPYRYHLSAMPQYMSLGDLPSKGCPSKPSHTILKEHSFQQSSPDQMQHSATSYNQSPYAQSKISNPTQGTKVHAQNGSNFPHYHSRASNTSNRDPKMPDFLNIQ